MDYFNPGTMLPQNAWQATSGLGGFLGGMGVANNQAGLERSFRDSDLGFLEKLNQYEMLKAQNPAQLAEYQQRKNTADVANQVFGTGKPLDVALSNADTQISGNQAKTSENQQTVRLNRMRDLYDLSQEIKQSGINPGIPNEGDVQKYKTIKQHYPNLKDLPDYPTADNLASIQAAGDRAFNSPEYQQALAKARAPVEAAMPAHRLAAESAENVANIQGKFHLAGIQQSQGLDKVTANLMTKYASGTASPQEIDALNAGLQSRIMPALIQGIDMQLTAIRNSKLSPEQKAQATQEVMKRYQLIPGGTQGQPAPATPAPTAPAKKAPNPGDVVKGYRFKGGDPSKPESWEKQ